MPKPLFSKLVAVAAIGFLCLLGGSVYALSTGDRILLMLSILIGACSLIRFLLLLRDIRSGSYYVLSGICVKREPSLFKKSQQITFKSDEGKEYHFTFEKSIKLLVYYDENVPLFRRNGYRKSGTMILRVRSRDTALN